MCNGNLICCLKMSRPFFLIHTLCLSSYFSPLSHSRILFLLFADTEGDSKIDKEWRNNKGQQNDDARSAPFKELFSFSIHLLSHRLALPILGSFTFASRPQPSSLLLCKKIHFLLCIDLCLQALRTLIFVYILY